MTNSNMNLLTVFRYVYRRTELLVTDLAENNLWSQILGGPT